MKVDSNKIKEFKNLLYSKINNKIYTSKLKIRKTKEVSELNKKFGELYKYFSDNEMIIEYKNEKIFLFSEYNFKSLAQFIREFKNLIKINYYKDENKESVLNKDRDNFTKEMKIKLNEKKIPLKLIQILSNISTDNEYKNIDSNLGDIDNAIEYYLFDEKKYKIIDNKISNKLDKFIDNEKIKQLKDFLQIFRHAKKEMIKERNEISNSEKEFLLYYGTAFLIEIDRICNKSN